jgi:hypothetical protein
MDWRQGIVRASVRGQHGARRRRDAEGTRRAQGRVGWLAIACLLLHGWLPLIIQAQLVVLEAGGHAHRANAAGAAAPAAVPFGEGPECPLFHSAICLCAVFAKLLPTCGPFAPGAAFAARRRRSRLAASRPSRPRPALLFDARAPPVSG